MSVILQGGTSVIDGTAQEKKGNSLGGEPVVILGSAQTFGARTMIALREAYSGWSPTGVG
jgi:hypothetical protein